MKNKLTTTQDVKCLTNLIILDASGSMYSKRAEVIGGLAQILSQIKQDAERDFHNVKTTTIVTDFASHGDFNVPINSRFSVDLQPDQAEEYKTRGMTALYDAIAKSFDLVPEDQDGVFVTIFTDGAENDSKEMNHEAVKDLISRKKKKEWTITFMGTSEADINKAVNLGVSRGNTMSFTNTAEGVNTSFSKMSSVRSAYYQSSVGGQSVDLDNLMEEPSKTIKKEEDKNG